MNAKRDDIDILISEVGPRDGLQNIDETMPTAAKCEWIAAEARAGVSEIEVGSFVPAKVLPQLADTAEVVAFAARIEGLAVAALAPNLRGVADAIKAGAHKITMPLSVSETHSERNVRRTHAQMFEEIRAAAALRDEQPRASRPTLEVGLSTAFGCTIEGRIAPEKVFACAERAMACGADEVGLADTSGYGNPAQLKRLTLGVWDAVGRERLSGVHLHNTRGQGLANVMAALEVGLTTIDSSLGGMGGCPFAPGASGNIVTEDLAFLLESMGLRTGVDLERLLEVRRSVGEKLSPGTMYGYLVNSGLPKGFRGAAPR